MDYKCNKQYWLENVLKKLHKKKHSLQKKKPRNQRRKKINVPLTNAYAVKNQRKKLFQRKEKSVKYQIVTRHAKQKSIQKHVEKKKSNREKVKFWKFVDAFLQSRSFLSRNKNGFFIPVIPSAINNALLKSIGHTLTLRSRVVSRHASNKSISPGDYAEEGFLRSVLNANGDRKALAQKVFLTIQKARMKRATDIIAKEVLGGRKAKKS